MSTVAAGASGSRALGGAAAPAAPPAAVPYSDISEYRWIILVGLITAAIMEVLDTTIVNVALPQMAGNLGATNQEIGWVSTGYILSNVIVLPMTAFLGARFGRRNYLAFSTILFIVASFFCGTSHSLGELVLWRIIQGAGGAALLSTSQATLRQIFPASQQGIVQALFLIGIIVAPTLGPTLGGWITDNYTWNWCFFINVPIGITSVFILTTFLKDPPGARSKASVDWLGIGLLAVGLGALQYVLEEGQQDDWFQDAWIVRFTILSGFCLASMLFWELSSRNKSPVVDFRVMKNRDLAAGLFLFIALGFGLYGGTYLYPLFAQTILGFTPTETGLALLPGGLLTALAAVICGVILNRPKPLIDARLLIIIGVALFMYSMWKLGHLTVSSGEDDTKAALMIRGFGLGFLFTPINNAVYANLKRNEVQQASGLINLARQLGGSFGIAALGTFVTNHTQFHRVDLLRNIYAGNTILATRLQGTAAVLVGHGYSHAQATGASYGMLNGTINRQAATMSYNDAFLLILITFTVTAPAVFLLRKKEGASSGPAPDAH